VGYVCLVGYVFWPREQEETTTLNESRTARHDAHLVQAYLHHVHNTLALLQQSCITYTTRSLCSSILASRTQHARFALKHSCITYTTRSLCSSSLASRTQHARFAQAVLHHVHNTLALLKHSGITYTTRSFRSSRTQHALFAGASSHRKIASGGGG